MADKQTTTPNIATLADDLWTSADVAADLVDLAHELCERGEDPQARIMSLLVSAKQQMQALCAVAQQLSTAAQIEPLRLVA